MYLLICSLWPILFFYLNKTNQTNNSGNTLDENTIKINRNIISAIHSVVFTAISAIAYNMESQLITSSLVYFSISYFVWDSYFIIVKRLVSEYMFILHHTISIYILEHILAGNFTKILTLLFMYGELSNFPRYIVYHQIKTINKDEQSFKLWRHIQICWFTTFRCIVFGYYALKIPYLIDNYFILGLCYFMYFVGIYWGVGQIKGIYYDYYATGKTNLSLKNE